MAAVRCHDHQQLVTFVVCRKSDLTTAGDLQRLELRHDGPHRKTRIGDQSRQICGLGFRVGRAHNQMQPTYFASQRENKQYLDNDECPERNIRS
jgi:hypothetical protein